MNRFYRTIFLVFFYTKLLFGSTPISFSIFHWNDLHSFNTPQAVRREGTHLVDSLGGVQYLGGLLNEWRSSTPISITLDAGDEFTGGPISALTKGKKQAEVLNLLKPDFIAIGNHEFDYGLDALRDFEKSLDSSITLSSANIVSKETKQSLFTQEKLIERDGLKIAVIGLTLENLSDVVHPKNLEHISVESIYPIVRDFVRRMEPIADVILAVTHQGLEEDIRLAMSVDGIDCIVGGHSHSLLDKDYIVNGTRIVQAGQYGRYLGRVDLLVDTLQNRVIQSSAYIAEVGPNRNITPDSNLLSILFQHEKLVEEHLGKVIGELQNDFIRQRDRESNLGNWVCQSLRRYTQSDIGIYNSGGLRIDWLRGPIRIKDVWQLEPFGNSLVKVQVSGSELKKMFEYRLENVQDFIQTSGIKLKSKGKKLISFQVNDKTLQEDVYYTIATNSYVVSQWHKYFGYSLKQNQITDLNIPIRDVLVQQIERDKIISSTIQNWWIKE